MIKSKALEVNLAHTQVDVDIDPQYACLQQVMASYYGLLDGLNTFLKEVSHPYKNWQFIVQGARGFALDYFHLMRAHEQGVAAAGRLVDIFLEALSADTDRQVKTDAADNLILFLQKIIKTAEDQFSRFEPLVNNTFDRVQELPEDLFGLFVRSYYPLHRLAETLMGTDDAQQHDFTMANRLLVRNLKACLNDWLGQKDPFEWFLQEAEISDPDPGLKQIFTPITHAGFRTGLAQLPALGRVPAIATYKTLNTLCAMGGHNDIVQAYRRIPQLLLDAGGEKSGHQWKVIFLFHCMSLEGLELIHEDILRDINRTINWLIAHQSGHYIQNLVQKTFAILKTTVRSYPATALSCVLNMGKGIFETDDGQLIDNFINDVIDLGFQSPQIKGVGNDWQIRVNHTHLQNIRTWLSLIELRPASTTRLLSSLIVHLAVSGVFIRDTDIFGRDITRLLDSNITSVYNLVKQLARLFPVYFNDIGAEGELRDISTRIDETCHRQDPLIHFLRKQSHVEGSNRILKLMDAAHYFWQTRDKSRLVPFLPPNIYEQIETSGPYIDGVHHLLTHLDQESVEPGGSFLQQSQETLNRELGKIQGATATDRERVILFREFYNQLNNKYNLDFKNLKQYVDQLPSGAFPKLDHLKNALMETDLKHQLDQLINYLNLLKSIILTPESYEVREDIYKKRHFTVDIPSTYGSYHELKFNAMGLTLRIEALVNVLFEELINTIDLSFITKATCHQIYTFLALFNKSLKIDGIASAELEHQLDLLSQSLEIRGISFTQYLDIFKGFAQAVKNVINDYFNNIHTEHVTQVLASLTPDNILEKYFPNGSMAQDIEKVRHRTSEIFFRDRLATSLGLQQLDLFLSRILNTLFHQSNRLPKERLRRLLNYDPERVIARLHIPEKKARSIIYLGNKGLNLIKLNRIGLPVPPGFIITTEVYRCREIIESFPPALDNFRGQVAVNIGDLEKVTGKRFGNPANPLLVSVRSGSSISQPGMMDTFINVGMNEAIAEGLGARTDNAWFAWDNYRRFLQCYGMALGLQRNDFDAIIADYKKELGIPLKKEFSGDHMKQVALSYKQLIQDAGFEVPDDPMVQLHQTIQNVLDSWESDKARTYRHIMGISDDWGTAITVQAMVFGNLSQHSGAGVIFTHNPRWAGESLSLWGDFTIENQGEDVVSGLVNTLPISVKQQEIEMRETDITLETHFPEIYRTMADWAQDLVFHRGWSPQEMEFTFEGPTAKNLFMLQTRDMAIRERKRVLAFDPEQDVERIVLGHGIGVGAGAMSGRLVFTLQEVEHWRKQEPDTALILARADTVPDDIKEIFAADGLLTARGGVTSHAAVVAHRLGKACVVGCGNMICDERNRVVQFAHIELGSGDHISIDGREGSVYQGLLKIKET